MYVINAAVFSLSRVVQWSKEMQLQEVQVPQALLRLLCSWRLLPELQLQLLHEHRGKQVSHSASCLRRHIMYAQPRP